VAQGQGATADVCSQVSDMLPRYSFNHACIAPSTTV
jgi:hypothetical protein